MTKLVLIALFIFSANAGFAQTKEITREEYYAPLRAAMQKARGLTRRVTSVTFTYKDDKAETNEWESEYVLPDKTRIVHIETIGGKVRRTEQVDIGKIKYCKKDDSAWEISVGYCIGGSGSGGPSGIVSTQYSVEKVNLGTRIITIFRNITTYQNNQSPNKETEGLSYWYTNYWLDEDASLLREETKVGLVKGETLRRKTITGYVVDPTIKIEAPMKSQ